VSTVPTRRRLLSGALALELAWLILTAAVVFFLAAHFGDGPDDVTGDVAVDRVLVYLVPPITAALALAIVGARRALDGGAWDGGHLTRSLRLAVWMTAAGNAGLAATIAVSLYHAEASWVVLGGALLVAVAVITVGLVRVARPAGR
jgi:hypothetical protein